MSFKKVKKYFDEVGLGQCVAERKQIGATVKQVDLEEFEANSSNSGWIDVCKGWFVNENEQ